LAEPKPAAPARAPPGDRNLGFSGPGSPWRSFGEIGKTQGKHGHWITTVEARLKSAESADFNAALSRERQ